MCIRVGGGAGILKQRCDIEKKNGDEDDHLEYSRIVLAPVVAFAHTTRFESALAAILICSESETRRLACDSLKRMRSDVSDTCFVSLVR